MKIQRGKHLKELNNSPVDRYMDDQQLQGSICYQDSSIPKSNTVFDDTTQTV